MPLARHIEGVTAEERTVRAVEPTWLRKAWRVGSGNQNRLTRKKEPTPRRTCCGSVDSIAPTARRSNSITVGQSRCCDRVR
eukprot:4849800-Amphidinium_carterae.1